MTQIPIQPPVSSRGLQGPCQWLRQWLCENLFASLPVSIAVIDRERNIVNANSIFELKFGPFSGRRCFEAYKHRSAPCEKCRAMEIFRDGKTRHSYERGIDRSEAPIDYLMHLTAIPGRDGDPEVGYVLQTAMDITPWARQEEEYRLFYEHAPCTIAVLDRDYRIVRGNPKLKSIFGSRLGRPCYEVFKNQPGKCPECPAERTFQDGGIYHAMQTGQTQEGKVTHYLVTSAPLLQSENRVEQVIELSMDITQERILETEVGKLRAIQESLIENSNRGILATDQAGKIMILNHALESLLQRRKEEIHSLADLEPHLPALLRQIIREGTETCLLPGGPPVRAKAGEEIPVRFTNICLKMDREILGYASFFEDLREIKKLEKEKLDAERLAAVGQTVAGIAHGVKNIIMGLEGGLYVVKSASKKQDSKLAEEGWRMLENNIMKISALIKDFLNFSKGREPQPQWIQPAQIARDVIALYEEAARKEGITLLGDLAEGIGTAPMDPQGIHSCLANLVSNAIDACRMSDPPGGRIVVSLREREGVILYEVLDNGCGMDYEVKKKVFTTFFSTKGMGGTGVGLLTTRKIVQEHGGKIEFESMTGKGSRFTMVFPRNRLPKPVEEKLGYAVSEKTP
jgi:PAS domain S-box-containing protein